MCAVHKYAAPYTTGQFWGGEARLMEDDVDIQQREKRAEIFLSR